MSDVMRARFDEKWTPEPNSGCWLWTAATTVRGYGCYYYRRKLRLAHRVSWAWRHGPVPDGLQVLHRCDVPCCVNPDHLFLGTHADNMADMSAKNRNRASRSRGEINGRAVLTAADVIAIRSSAEPTVILADRYRIGECAIRAARRGHSWRHL